MKSQEAFEKLPELWKRVEAARSKPEGSAPLMPRKKKRPPIRIPPDGADPTSSAFPG